MKTPGPKLKVDASCFDCTYERSEGYRVQGDSGHDVYCDHPNDPGKRIGDTTWTTPEWCPILAEALARFAGEVARRALGEEP